MIQVNLQNTRDFSEKIGFQLDDWLLKFFNFYQNNFPIIIAFYSGYINSFDSKNFDVLKDLQDDLDNINDLIQINSYKLVTLIDWEFVDYIGDLEIELGYFKRVDKFLRSSIENPHYTTKFEFDSTLKSETLESLSNRVLNSGNYNNDWVDIAKRNDLQEKDYTCEGGNNIIVAVDLSVRSGAVATVIDNMTGEKILGLDLCKKITFQDDDLKTLNHQETFTQSVDILANLMKRDIPEFLDFGRDGFVGVNVFAFAATTFVRQMIQIFASDDTMKDFIITEFDNKNSGDYSVKFQVSSKLELTRTSQININNI